MKQYQIALNFSKEWEKDSVLTDINGLCGGIKERITTWSYGFLSPSSARQIGNKTYYDWMRMNVYANGTPSLTINGTIADNHTIINWTIDSDEALQTINNVTEMNRYIHSEGVLLEVFCLKPRSQYGDLDSYRKIDNDDAVWHGIWMRSEIAGSPDTPMAKEIWVDAHDGTVLKIH